LNNPFVYILLVLCIEKIGNKKEENIYKLFFCLFPLCLIIKLKTIGANLPKGIFKSSLVFQIQLANICINFSSFQNMIINVLCIEKITIKKEGDFPSFFVF